VVQPQHPPRVDPRPTPRSQSLEIPKTTHGSSPRSGAGHLE
jgi:hypothetical protein